MKNYFERECQNLSIWKSAEMNYDILKKSIYIFYPKYKTIVANSFR